MPEAKFKVLEEMKARELNRLKRANSHLALGVFYALEGMTTEAEKEFQILADNWCRATRPSHATRGRRTQRRASGS